MKKLFYLMPIVCALVAFFALNFFGFGSQKHSNASNVSVTATVLQYLNFSITSNASVPFGNLTPGTPIAAPSAGTVASCTTNSANGYTIGLSDGSTTNSALVHTDATTYIADYAGTIATPTTWTATGLGVTLFAADTAKEAVWGTGTTYADALNKYAGVPLAATTAHTVTGYHAGADTSSWAFKLDVPNSQKTGSYSGNVVFTATAVLS